MPKCHFELRYSTALFEPDWYWNAQLSNTMKFIIK